MPKKPSTDFAIKAGNKKLKKFLVMIITFLFVMGKTGECREVVFAVNAKITEPIVWESVKWGKENLTEEVGIVKFNDLGAGILTALDILTPKFNTERDIILITNDEASGEQSAKNFQAGLEQARWLGIKVYLVELRHDVKPRYKLYDNVKFLPINSKEMLTTMRTILQGDFHTPHIELPTNNLTQGTIKFEVPIKARRYKICLLSSSVGSAALKNYTPAIQGKFINIFEIDNPPQNNFELEIDYPQGTGLTLDVIPTVEGTLQADTSTRFFKNILEITPIHDAEKILADKYFDDKLINLRVNDKDIEGRIQDGTIYAEVNEDVSLQKIDFEDIGIIFEGDDTAKVELPKNYFAWVIAAVGILIILWLIWRIRNKKPIIKTKNSKLSYGGKLILYVKDNAPREFNLFRMNSAQIKLSEILSKCNIEIFNDAENILINPAEKGIILENKSDSTITQRNNLIAKGAAVELNYNDSVNVASEMVLEYKSLKPKE